MKELYLRVLVTLGARKKVGYFKTGRSFHVQLAILGVLCLVNLGGASELTDALRNYSRACGVSGVLLEYLALMPPPTPALSLRPAWPNDGSFVPPYDEVFYVAFYDSADNGGYIPSPQDSIWLRFGESVIMLQVPQLPEHQVPGYVDWISQLVRGLSCNFASYDSLLSSIDTFYTGFVQSGVLITIDNFTYEIDRLITQPCPEALHDSVFVTPAFTFRFRHYADSVGWGYLSHHGGFWQPMWDSVTSVLVGCFEATDNKTQRLSHSCQLAPNYPNPFNATTNIVYHVPSARCVALRITNVQGHEVAVLEDGLVQPGTHQVTFYRGNLSSGIYFARLEAGPFAQVQKLILLR